MITKMITQYPEFTKLSIDLKPEIKQITSSYAPYSDFDFTSLFCWDTNDSTGVSLLNQNLVIRLPDYLTGETVISILGEHLMDESITKLLSDGHSLHLIPEISVAALKHPDLFIVTEDRDNFDYIYELKALVDLSGKKYKLKRNKANNFMRSYEESLDLKKIRFGVSDDLLLAKEVFMKWAKERQRSPLDIDNEYTAIARALDFASQLNLMGVLVYINDLCVGFSINEIIDEKYAICHFQKAILEYEHLDVFISNLVAKELFHYGCTYVNWEQDLGIEGLRQLKSSYQNYGYLKKYTVETRA